MCHPRERVQSFGWHHSVFPSVEKINIYIRNKKSVEKLKYLCANKSTTSKTLQINTQQTKYTNQTCTIHTLVQELWRKFVASSRTSHYCCNLSLVFLICNGN